MDITQNTSQICEPQKDLEVFRQLVFTHAPALGRLLDNLDAGIVPEPLEVMSAISQGVAYFTEHGPGQDKPDQLVGIYPGMSCDTC